MKMIINYSMMNLHIFLNFERRGAAKKRCCFYKLNVFCFEELHPTFKQWIPCFQTKGNISILKMEVSISERQNLCINCWSLYWHKKIFNFCSSSQLSQWFFQFICGHELFSHRIYLKFLSVFQVILWLVKDITSFKN